jgi:hypothetical protein
LRDSFKVLKELGNECDKSPNCALYQIGKSSLEKIYTLMDQLKKKPMLVKNTEVPGLLTFDDIEFTVFYALFVPSTWPKLMEAIALALNGDAKMLYELSSSSNNADCTNDNSAMMARYAIACADADDYSKTQLSEWLEFLSDYEKNVSTFAMFQWASPFLTCRHWKRFEQQERFTGPWNGTFANPVLLVSNIFDPVTPLASAIETHEQMKRGDQINSVLLIQDGRGHCSNAQPSKCSAQYTKEYLLNGKLPKEGTVCNPDVEVFPASVNSMKNDEVLDALKFINQAIRETTNIPALF